MFRIFRKNKKIVEDEDSKQVAEDLSLAFDEIQKHIEKHSKPYVEPSDNEILEQLEFQDNYEAAFLIRDLKKQVKVLKTKLTVLQKKYDAIKAEQDKLDDGFKNYMEFIKEKHDDNSEKTK
jgi:hypothetical protein